MITNNEFITATTDYIQNIIAIGVCSNVECCNAFHPSLFTLPQSPHTEIPILITNEIFIKSASVTNNNSNSIIINNNSSVGIMGRQLCSSPNQLGLSLEAYVRNLFTIVENKFKCSLETFLHCLWLLEKLQTRNILLQQKRIVAMRDEDRSVTVIKKKNSLNSTSTFSSSVSSTAETISVMEAPIDRNNSNNNSNNNNKENNNTVPILSPTSTYSEFLSVGPFSDSDGETICRACTESQVFSLQFWNIQLFLSATLLLSLKINEDIFVNVEEEEELTHQFSIIAGCNSNLLRCAEQCVCEILWNDLRITDKGRESVMRRLGVQIISF